MKLYTEKFVRSLSNEDRRKLCKESAEMANHYVKQFSATVRLMQKQTGLFGNNYLSNDPVWVNHPLYKDLARIESLQYKHDANVRLLRDF